VQTRLADFIRDTHQGREADAILRSCVHCGFCTATCPTYQLLGDELDGPRGRIYLIKQVLEGQLASRRTQLHLDRCLTCRACETTCPSGVRYGRLADMGRGVVEKQVTRPLSERFARYLLRLVVPYPARFALLLRLGQAAKPVLPASLRRKIPRLSPPSHPSPEKGERGQLGSAAQHARAMLVLEGCIQPSTSANTNAAATRVLDRLGIRLISAPGVGCCGALSHHLSAEHEAFNQMRRNIDAWWPHLEAGAEAIVMTASGCGVMVKEYGDLLRHDAAYAVKAAKISTMTRDIAEIIAGEIELASARLSPLIPHPQRIAFHSPCTLQHGQQLAGKVEGVLARLGFTLTPPADAHLCCGSAGTYSILQSKLSQQLLANKLDALRSGNPDTIATANIGCQLHLQSGTDIPVRHWIELVDEALSQ
jgi:glycolate oxidase iron-sulfur subunit